MTATTTIVGNTTADVELRYTANGTAVANFTVASTEKVFDRQANEWKDGKKLFMRCTAWRDLAEHIANSISKGTRVVVVGKIATREFEDREGNKRTTIELEVDEIGPSLRYATAQVTRAQANRGAPEPAAEPVDSWSLLNGDYSDSTPF
ncbi:single-stranded DNA-binding protein [Agromyces sp. NBRC 114283]|uniref:single-stranded DNA-binding protein n=1 Tax=Agromyces sp. NBRC 114283 TaxID=2994521 RepID=UPI0024A026F1|nr:single-stranded DNA-binding protein [Agromyces sp. NBRC 114283]GLU88917.1 single-stranded DNA-binding protein [Agromyces sp. NBRC 114283]